MSSTLLLHLSGEEPRELHLPELDVSDRTASLSLFAEAVRTGREPETSARDNIRSLAIVLGCVASIETGAVVAPPSGHEDAAGAS
jgi:predicted dehydrogenase